MKGMELTFDQKTILVTGGTGSFGRAFVSYLLSNFSPEKVIIFSRDEMKQWQMSREYVDNPRVRFFVGCVRDRDRLERAFKGVDIVIHAAATKIVPTAERDPFECIKTNVIGAMNVIDAAIDNKVGNVVALSTDKACSPINLYGASKLASDKLFIAANVYGTDTTRFSVVRYGNVMGSRGSVIPFFLEIAKTGVIPITDFRMTRFMITLEQGIELVTLAVNDMIGGEIYVKKIPSIKITELASAIAPDAILEEVGIRPGEKIHEQMITVEDSQFTYEYSDYYKILPNTIMQDQIKSMINGGKLVEPDFYYTSDNNKEWYNKDSIMQFINSNKDIFLKI